MAPISNTMDPSTRILFTAIPSRETWSVPLAAAPA
jgi:hypothetical protein